MKTLSRYRAALPALFLILVVFTPQATHAQALPTAAGPGSYIAVGAGASIFQTDYGKRDIAGLTAYADLNPTWRYGVEAEARFLRFRTSEDVTETNYLIGPRAALRFGPMRPYVKFLVGPGRITLPYYYAQGSFLTYAPGGGVEYMPNDRLIVRILDVEYQLWPGFPYGELRPYGITAGISLRLNAVDRLPKSRSRAYARWSIPNR
jgi:hypothetical protein